MKELTAKVKGYLMDIRMDTSEIGVLADASSFEDALVHIGQLQCHVNSLERLLFDIMKKEKGGKNEQE